MSRETGITWPLDDNVTNKELAKVFHPKNEETPSPYKEPDYAYIHRELARMHFAADFDIAESFKKIKGKKTAHIEIKTDN
jgi:hypothetical protein